MGTMLSVIGTMYFSEVELFSDLIAYETEVSAGRQTSEVMTGHKPQVASLFGVPLAITEGVFFVDLDTDTGEGAYIISGGYSGGYATMYVVAGIAAILEATLAVEYAIILLVACTDALIAAALVVFLATAITALAVTLNHYITYCKSPSESNFEEMVKLLGLNTMLLIVAGVVGELGMKKINERELDVNGVKIYYETSIKK